jgi:ribonuclease E
MQPEQERVYGWFGLNPALLLDPVPSGDNLVVRVVRPGDDPEEVLEQARQQMAAAGSRRRRRGRGGEGRGSSPVEGAADAVPVANGDAPVASAAPMLTITPLPEPASVAPSAATEFQEVAVEAPPVRRRRRSSSAVAEAALSAEVGSSSAAEVPESVTATATAADADASGEPRRRRRRSSASG